MDNINELFWKVSVEEMKNGYIYEAEEDHYRCLICGDSFICGIIYPMEEMLYEAKKAVQIHIATQHGSVFQYLLNLNKKYTGLTDHQKNLLNYFYEGYSDKEIVEAIGGGSTSTIRNHRFSLKEREKQAKIFLAIMELLEESGNRESKFINIHRGATMVDERYAITQEEMEKVLKTYFKEGVEGPLHELPSKEKRKIIILQQIVKRFKNNQKYTEKEINEALKQIFHDHVTLRRYLIEYGFMERTHDGLSYWIKG